MRVGRFAVLLVVALLFVIASAAQTASQSVTLLQQALAAISHNTQITDVTLTGTAHRIAGSDDETGTATLKAIAGASRMDLNLSSGPLTEIMNISPAPVGSWSGPDGVSHPMAFHNLLLVDPTWFFPVFPISRGLSTGYAATYIGQETRNGEAVQHIAILQMPPAQPTNIKSPPGAPTLTHLSQIDLFLDSATLLPAAIDFNIHPDDDAGLDIPVEIQFSNYRAVNGVQIPFHVQKFLNNGLVLDLQFTSAALNTGLSTTEFAVSAQ